MTKSHKLHRKKAVNMIFRKSAKIRRSYFKIIRLSEVVELLRQETGVKGVKIDH